MRIRLAIVLGMTALIAVSRPALGSSPDGIAKRLDNMMPTLDSLYESRFWAHSPSDKFHTNWQSVPLVRHSVFSSARAALDYKMSVGSVGHALQLVEFYRGVALDHLDEPLALFKWGYASVLYSRRLYQLGDSYWRGYDLMRQRGLLIWSLAAAEDPRDYDYYRLRYLLDSGSPGAHPELLSFSQRLIEFDPSDLSILRCQAYLLCLSGQRDNFERAIQITKDLIAKQPDVKNYIGFMSSIYEMRSDRFGDQNDVLLALDWLKRYLAILPASCVNAKSTQHEIEVLSKEINH
jgi:hypothetical protein